MHAAVGTADPDDKGGVGRQLPENFAVLPGEPIGSPQKIVAKEIQYRCALNGSILQRVPRQNRLNAFCEGASMGSEQRLADVALNLD